VDNSATGCGVNDRHVTDNGDEYKRVDGDGRFTESVPRPTRRGIGRILSGIQRAVQTVLGVYLKHPAHQGFLAIMRYTNPRTHTITHWVPRPTRYGIGHISDTFSAADLSAW